MTIPKRRKTVRFFSESLLHCYEHPEAARGYSSWYTRDEEKSFKLQAKADIVHFKTAKACGRGTQGRAPSDACPVGLEQSLISNEHTRKRIMTKKLVELAVLVEQARPIHHANDDKVERIAAASRVHSEWSREQAQTIGMFQAIKRFEESGITAQS